MSAHSDSRVCLCSSVDSGLRLAPSFRPRFACSRAFLLDCKPWSENDETQKDAARKQGDGSSWLSNLVAEWRAGDWNHLDGVPEPEDDRSA